MYKNHILKTFFLRLPVCLFFLLSTMGCEHLELADTGTGPTTPSELDSLARFSIIQENVFNQNCALSGCHLGGSAPFGLDLSEGNSFGNLVNVPSQEIPELMRVNPGKPDSSYIIWKLEGRPEIVGARMPFGRDPLPDELIETIRRWIGGATNN